MKYISIWLSIYLCNYRIYVIILLFVGHSGMDYRGYGQQKGVLVTVGYIPNNVHIWYVDIYSSGKLF